MAPIVTIPGTSIEAKPERKNKKITPPKNRKGAKRKPIGRIRKGAEKCPIFLQKTYFMVDTCIPEIASWSEEREVSFVIKNPKRFASEIIPQYFKHSNFASFVRQLNFYGFRKIKTDFVKLIDESNHVEAGYWYFRHDKFLKGRKDLLHEISKGKHEPMEDHGDVDDLRTEVLSLQEKVSFMDDEISKVSTLMQRFTLNSKKDSCVSEFSNDTNDVLLTNFHSNENSSDLINFSTATDRDLLLEDRTSFCHNVKDIKKIGEEGSIENDVTPICELSADMDIIDSKLFIDLENDDVAMSLPCETKKAPLHVGDNGSKSNEECDINFRQPLYDCLAVLPRKIQEEVINGLAATVTNPDFFDGHIDAITTIAKILADIIGANNSAEHVEGDPPSNDGASEPSLTSDCEEPNQHPDLTYKFVSTVLAAILTHQKPTISRHNCQTNTSAAALPIQV